MLTSDRAFRQASSSSPEMPRIPSLSPLYEEGVVFRQGQLVMIAGRPGHFKSALAMWMVLKWARPTLYLSGDMGQYDATMRMASMNTGWSRQYLEKHPERVRHADHINWSFGAITLDRIMTDFEAWVDTYSAYPEIIVVDNLMDFEGAESDYQLQMAAMQRLTELCRASGAMVIVLHHCTEASFKAKTEPFSPPSRNDIQNKLATKPELILTTSLNEFGDKLGVACVKQRSGPADPAARAWAKLDLTPHLPMFGEWTESYDHARE